MNNLKNKNIGIIIIALWLVAWAAPAIFGDVVHALPQNGTVAAGNSTITQPDANTMRINQSTDKSIINWQGYSIGTNEKVQYFQPNTNSISLNRVAGADPSLIYGQLSANGQVWVINPNGLLVGQNAKINVGGFLASTLNINDNDFINGKYQFAAGANGRSPLQITSITNQGNINAADGGYVVLISPTINNSGNITANSGSVNMASGDDVTLTFANNGLINLVINKQTAADALGITNSGTITADSGQVIISAQTAGDLLKTVINNTGVIQARTISNQNGVIKLLGGMENNSINVGGTLDASAPNGGDGGFVETSGAHVQIEDGARVSTAAPQGKPGTWLIDPVDFTIAASGGDMTGATLSTNLGTGNVAILSSSGATAGSGDINVNDAVSWSATALTLTAARDININAVMTASGTSGLAMRTATANGADSAVASGTVKVGFDTNGAFKGRVDFGARSGTGFLSINGNVYTVINSLGAAGSNTAADLQGMQGFFGGRYALGSNIDATATSGWNAGAGFLPVGTSATAFTGVFDGLGHTITGLTINRPTSSAVGLFGYTTSSTIRNIGLAGGAVSGGIDYAGGLVGYCNATTAITNSYSTGSVTGYSGYVGGLVGDNLGTITNSYSTGSVTGVGTTYSVEVGGLVGVNWYGTISNSYATGSVTGSATTYAAIAGGLVGWNNYSTITNSYSTGTVSGKSSVGGLVGQNTGTGTISNTYATGAVTGSGNSIGGLVGQNFGTISNSYSTGSVTGTTYVGGLVGYNLGTITNSYWDTTTSGRATSAGGTGLTTAQMKTMASFTGWDFTNTWRIYEGNTYPLLKSFLTPLTITANNASKTYDGLTYSGGNGVTYSSAPNANLLGTVSYSGTSQGAINAGSYAITPGGYWSNQQGYDISYVGGTLTINPATLTLLNIAANNASKTYGATLTFTGAEFTPVGLAGGDTISGVTLTSAGAVATANAGAYAITPSNAVFSVGSAGNYNITYVNGALTVNPAPLTITGAVANNKVYDGATTAMLSNIGALSGLIGGETLTLNTPTAINFVDKNAGIGKTVTASGYTIANGTGLASNYTLASTSATATADITAAALTITAATNTKTYNADTTAAAVPTITAGTLYGADSANFIETFDTKNAGTGKTLTASGTVNDGNGGNNYTYTFITDTTGVINPAPLTVTANAATKTYDGLAYTGGNGVGYAGFVNGETSAVLGGSLAYNGTSQGATNAGSYVITPSGQTSGNYTISYANGALTVNPAALTVTGAVANNKIYDGTTTATLSNNGALSGLIGGETLTLNAPTAINFVDKNAGIGKTVTASGYTIANGTGLASNYQLASNSVTTAEITPAALTVTGATTQNKVYDGNTTATAIISGVTLSGIIGLDTVTISGGSSSGGSFADKNVGAAKPVIAALALTGADAGNYTLIQPIGLTADITPAAVTITGAVANNKTYDGTTTATLSNTGSLSGLIGGETLILNAPTAIIFSDKNAGVSKTVTASGYTIADGTGLVSNYQLTSTSATTTADINRAALTVSGVTAQNKVYDGATTTVITGAALSGVIGLDTVTIGGGGSFADKNVGAAKPVTATLALTGADAGNYALASNFATTTADITPAMLTPVYAANNKAYDAATTATVAANGAASGVVIGDTINFANTAANFSDKNAGVGKTVTITGIGISGADAGNYTLASNSATTTADITPASLTITADNQIKTYGSANPALTATYTGLVSGETSALVSGLTLSTTATTASSAGNYPVTASGATAANYAITYIDGVMTVTPVITAAPNYTAVTDYTNVINEGIGNFGGNKANEPAPQPLIYGTAYASAESPVFTYTAGGISPLITDYQPRKDSKHHCLMVKKDGKAAIVETECK